MEKKTKIVATISDRRCDVEFIRSLYEAGMNVVRINSAHTSFEGATNIVNNTRAVSEKIASDRNDELEAAEPRTSGELAPETRTAESDVNPEMPREEGTSWMTASDDVHADEKPKESADVTDAPSGEPEAALPQEEPADKEEAKTPAKDFEKEAAEWKDKYIRLQAEFDNFRKRTLKEKMDLVQSGGSKVITGMLQVLDDVLRAVEASEKSEDIAALREGEKLVAQKFTEALRKEGVTEIEAKGHDFDADLHEAVAKFAAGEEQKGKVIDVVQRGYKLGDKVLRYAKVVVGE